MNKKLYWGLGVLFLLITGVFVLILVQQKAELAKYEEDYALPTEKVADKKTPQNGQEVDTSHPNYHVHSDGTPHVGTHDAHAPIAQPIGVSNKMSGTEVTYPMPDNPVKALREYLDKRGHWSAKWIPDFPPDDIEASTLASNVFIMVRHKAAGNAYYDGAALIPNRVVHDFLAEYRSSKKQRSYDLYKLTWGLLDNPLPYPEGFKGE